MQDRAHQSQGRRQLNDRVRLTPVHPSREPAQPMGKNIVTANYPNSLTSNSCTN